MRLTRLRLSSALLTFVCGSVLSLLAFGAGAHAGEATWPHEFKVDGEKIVLYEPQFESLEQDTLKGRTAVAITPPGRTTPLFGAAWLESQVAIDRDARTVRAKVTKVTRVHLPDSTPEEEARLQERMARVAPDLEFTISLDRLTATLEAARNERRTALALNMTPPRILFEKSAAFLVVLDGPPKTIKVQGTALERVVNTPSFIVRDTKKGRHYLKGAGRWYEADQIAGPWKAVEEPPDAVSNLWEKGGSGQKHGIEEPEVALPASGEGEAPRAIVATEPTELVVSDGEPEFAPISGLDLLYMSNTRNDVLMEVGSQSYYVLLSGRWFRSRSLEGPWEHVRPDLLPESFAKIPPGSAKGDLLASVAGTPQAEEAVLDSAVPQTAEIRKSDAKLTVNYDGEPKFRPIPKTGVEYAVNTDAQVMKIGGRYYAVDQGVWFESDSPTGPWEVADEAPPEAQAIPPDVPVYNTKYVYVYDSTPDRVYVGYLPGYLGYYPYYGSVVYGTGYYYPGWWGSAYYPYPATWGFGAQYSSWGGWSFGIGIGFGYGWYPYSPWYAWGYPGWWGPIGWYPCYGYHPYYPYYPYGPGVPVAGVPVRPPRGSNTNLYRLPENSTRVAQTRDKYAARIASAPRGHSQGAPTSRGGSAGQTSAPGRPTATGRAAASNRPAVPGRPTASGRAGSSNRPTTMARPAPQPGVTRLAPRQVGAPGNRPTQAGRPAPSARPPQAAPPAGSSPPSVRSAPGRSYPSVPSLGGGGRSVGGGRSFGGAQPFSGGRSIGGGRPMGYAPHSFGGGARSMSPGSRGFGGGMGGPRGGGHRGR